MKEFGLSCCLATFGIGLIVSAARGQTEMSGGICVSNKGCASPNCIAGQMTDTSCSGSPDSIMCVVLLNGNMNTFPFKVCLDTNNSSNCCAGAELGVGQNPVDCGQMDYWNCGCINGDEVCGIVSCGCTGMRNGQADLTADTTCTGC